MLTPPTLGLETFVVESCSCQNIMTTLVLNGLFPTSPSRPRVAMSIDLLELYHAFFQRSCEAVTAVAAALKVFYTFRGFIHYNSKVWRLPLIVQRFNDHNIQGDIVLDPFRKGIGHAVQWYDSLRRQVLQRVEDAFFSAEQVASSGPVSINIQEPCLSPSSVPVISIPSTQIDQMSTYPLSDNTQERPSPSLPNPSVKCVDQTSTDPLFDNTQERSSSSPPNPTTEPVFDNAQERPSSSPPNPPTTPLPSTQPATECARILQRRCPACFSGVKFGHHLQK